MRAAIRFEWRRMIRGKRFWISGIFGFLLVIAHMILILPGRIEMQNFLYENSKQYVYPNTVFNSCIFNCHSNIPFEVFYTILPMLAVLPYADSFYWDKKSGYLRQITMRMKKQEYYLAKYFVTFLSGALIVLVPMIFNFWMVGLFLPDLPPVGSTYPYTNLSLWNTLFTSHPYIFTALLLLITGIFSGLCACLALLVTWIFENRFVVLLFPLLMYLFSKYILEFAGWYRFSPYLYLRTGYVEGASTGIIVGEMIFLFLVTFLGFEIKGRKDEVL